MVRRHILHVVAVLLDNLDGREVNLLVVVLTDPELRQRRRAQPQHALPCDVQKNTVIRKTILRVWVSWTSASSTDQLQGCEGQSCLSSPHRREGPETFRPPAYAGKASSALPQTKLAIGKMQAIGPSDRLGERECEGCMKLRTRVQEAELSLLSPRQVRRLDQNKALASRRSCSGSAPWMYAAMNTFLYCGNPVTIAMRSCRATTRTGARF